MNRDLCSYTLKSERAEVTPPTTPSAGKAPEKAPAEQVSAIPQKSSQMIGWKSSMSSKDLNGEKKEEQNTKVRGYREPTNVFKWPIEGIV